MRIWRTCSPTINAPPIFASASAGGASLCGRMPSRGSARRYGNWATVCGTRDGEPNEPGFSSEAVHLMPKTIKASEQNVDRVFCRDYLFYAYS